MDLTKGFPATAAALAAQAAAAHTLLCAPAPPLTVIQVVQVVNLQQSRGVTGCVLGGLPQRGCATSAPADTCKAAQWQTPAQPQGRHPVARTHPYPLWHRAHLRRRYFGQADGHRMLLALRVDGHWRASVHLGLQGEGGGKGRGGGGEGGVRGGWRLRSSLGAPANSPWPCRHPSLHLSGRWGVVSLLPSTWGALGVPITAQQMKSLVRLCAESSLPLPGRPPADRGLTYFIMDGGAR